MRAYRHALCGRSTVAAAVAGIAAGVSLVHAGTAVAAPMTCGATITSNTKLDRDLNNCFGDGVVIGAPNITLDLNGHTIDGQGLGTGVSNAGGFDGVTIKDGKIRQFTTGVHLQSASGNRLIDLSLVLNGGEGILLLKSSGNRIEDVSSTDNATDGIFIGDNSDDNRVEDSSALDNGNTGVVITGPLGAGSDRNRIEEGQFLRNANFGIAIEQDSANTRVRRNEATANLNSGVLVAADAGPGTRLERNTANENLTDGLLVVNPLTTITRNTANNNASRGINGVAGVTDGGGNRASGNGVAQCVNVVCS